MKKMLTGILSAAAVFSMSFTSLAAEDPAAVFDRVAAKCQTMDSMDCHAGIHMVILPDESIAENRLNVDMEMQMKMDQIYSGDMRYLADTAVAALGQTVYTVSFYDDGYYYMDMEGLKLKYPMDMDELMQQSQNAMVASELSSSYMKGLSLTEENGVRILSYEVDPAEINVYMQDILGSLTQSGLAGVNGEMAINIREARGAYLLTDDDYYSFANMYMVFDMETMGQKMTVIMLMEIDVDNPGQPVEVVIPSKEGYQELEEYNQALNEALAGGSI